VSLETWKKKVLSEPGAKKRVAEISDELRAALALTHLREPAGLSQRELAERIGISQPRVVAIEKSGNVTLSVLGNYVAAVGGELQLSVVKAGKPVAPLTRTATGRLAVRKTAAKRSKTSSRSQSSRGGPIKKAAKRAAKKAAKRVAKKRA